MSMHLFDPSLPDDTTIPASFEEIAASDVLPEPIVRVLQAAYTKLKQSPSIDLDDHLTTRSTHKVLDTLSGFRKMRVVLNNTVDLTPLDADDGAPHAEKDAAHEIAGDLMSLDQETADHAVARVKKLLAQAKTDTRNSRSAARRQGRASAEGKAADRDRRRLEETREQRDTARAKLASSEEERRRAVSQLAELTNDLDDSRAQLVAVQHQLASLRASLTDVPTAAQRLHDALFHQPDATRSVVRDARDSVADLAAVGQTADAGPEEAPRLGSDAAALLAEAADHALSDVMDDKTRDAANQWLPRLLDAIARPPRLERITELALTVDVLGGGDEIGGSCVLITGGGTRILVDCGTRPNGNDEASMAPRNIDVAMAEKIDAIIVTHAHNDHGGWIPAVIAKQPHVPVFTTQATCDLLTTMWRDAAKVMLSQIGTSRWKGGPLPPYSWADAQTAIDRLRDISFRQVHRIGALEIELFQAGHIVGAAGVVVTAGEHRVVVTGDVSGNTQGTVGGFQECESARFADLVLLETTYAGQTISEPRHKVVNDFVRSVELTLEGGGVALVPSFALGRAQEVALICGERFPGAEVLVDGLARDISETYEDYNAPNGSPLRIFRENVRAVPRGKTVDEKIRLKSGIVISTSGMLSAGSPAVTWAQRVLPDPASALMLVGYQDPESPGGLLRKLDRGGTFTLSQRDGTTEEVHVQAKVEEFHLGAHANENELRTIAQRLRPRHLMLVHGERRNQLKFASKMLGRSQKTTLAERWTPGR